MLESLPEEGVTFLGYLPNDALPSQEPTPVTANTVTELSAIDGRMLVSVNAELIGADPATTVLASLLVCARDAEGTVYASTAEGMAGEVISLPFAGLPAGDYSAVVHVLAPAGDTGIDVRSPIVNVLADESAPVEFDNLSDSVEFLQQTLFEAMQHSRSVSVFGTVRDNDAVSYTGEYRITDAATVSFGAPQINVDDGTSIVIPVTNSGTGPVEDTVQVKYYVWDDEGNPLLLDTTMSELYVGAGQGVDLEIHSESVLGTDALMGVEVSCLGVGCTLQTTAFVLRGSELALGAMIGLNMSGGPLFAANAPAMIIPYFQFGELHCVKCEPFIYNWNDLLPPEARVIWKILGPTGKARVVHTLGDHRIEIHGTEIGRTKVRIEVATPNTDYESGFEWIEYGADVWVHQAQDNLRVHPPTVTYDRVQVEPPQYVYGKEEHTEKVESEVQNTIESSLGGSIGAEAVGAVSAQLKVSRTDKMTKSIEVKRTLDPDLGKCSAVWKIEVYKVSEGNWTKTFVDGNQIDGTYSVRELIRVEKKTKDNVECPD